MTDGPIARRLARSGIRLSEADLLFLQDASVPLDAARMAVGAAAREIRVRSQRRWPPPHRS